jgi:cholera toxin transcriptional activator
MVEMSEPGEGRRYRFGVFEADAATGELRRQGVRIKINAQPFQVLLLLLEQPGSLLTREQIAHTLWPDGTFVDYEHGVNSAVNRIREALGDSAGSPRFIETLARRGYRLMVPVESIGNSAVSDSLSPSLPSASPTIEPGLFTNILATTEELPTASHSVVRTLFALLQLMYVAFYVGALANLPEIEQLFSPLPRETLTLAAIIASAAILIPVRAFLLSAVLFRPPRAQEKLLKLWPLLLPFDIFWSLSPFLLMHHISLGLALACVALLVYSPFAQRSLVLMGATTQASANLGKAT